ncbi:MAG: amino acid permease, partial [Pseudomonadales bacterium]|nr:amino acid permease [Pseudomonadales bacterium]
LPPTLTIVVLVTALCALACWGIQQSVATAAAITLLEIGGLLLIIAVATVVGAPDNVETVSNTTSNSTQGVWAGLLGGSFLAFYAYIGFEDIVNVAEEVKSPQRAMPVAIAVALVTATLLYTAATFAALEILPPDRLAASEAPLADVYAVATGGSPWFISLISLFAVINGALIQIIMCSRIAFGLSQEELLPKTLGQLNSRTQTPINATVGVAILIAIAALTLSTETLARFTTTILLVVFILVNLALLRVKQNETEDSGAMVFPKFVPALGLVASAAFLLGEIVL